jgi:hypothetical protein
MKTLMESVIEIVKDNRGSMHLADALVFELIQWGVVPSDEGATFTEAWEDCDNEEEEEDV